MTFTELALPPSIENSLTHGQSAEQIKLAAVDWSFSARRRADAVESIHPYPAKFIGELPRALLQSLSCPKGTLVFDPFAGSGTTLLEAQRLGLPSVGIDLNPIACMIARVKTRPTPLNLSGVAEKIAKAAELGKSKVTWDIPNVDHWFKQEVQSGIVALLKRIDAIEDEAMRDTLRLALSSILVRVSNQDSDTRYAAVEKDVSRADVIKKFLAAAEKIEKSLQARGWEFHSAKVIQGNTLTVTPEALGGKVGIVITSPPYPNAYEYWLYHKYRMWWLGFDPIAVKEQEIGARAHFFKKNHHTDEHFREQMRGTFRLINAALVRGGYACFVIGRSKIHGKIVDNAEIIQSVSGEFGYLSVDRIERTISASRKSFNLSHANIKTESIVILQKN